MALARLVFLCLLASLSFAGAFNLTLIWTSHFLGNLLPMSFGDEICYNESDFTDCYGATWCTAEVITNYRAKYPNSLVLDTGDYAQGTPFTKVEPHLIFELYRIIEYNATGLGIYDADRVEIEPVGDILLAELGSPLSYPTVVTNYNAENVTALSFVKHTHTFIVNGTRVGLVAVCGLGTDGQAPIDFRGNFSMVDYLSGVRRGVDALLYQDVDIIIVLMNQAFDFDLPDAVVANIPGVDVILSDNEKNAYEYLSNTPGYGVSGPMPRVKYSPSGKPVLVGSAGQKGYTVGLLEIEFDENGGIVPGHWSGDSIPTPSAEFVLSPNSTSVARQVYARTMEVWKSTSGFLQLPVGNLSDTPYPFSEGIVRYLETPLANFAADAYRFATGAQLAVLNTGSVRGPLPSGNISLATINGFIPFSDRLHVINITGYGLVEAMGNSLLLANITDGSGDPRLSGRYLSLSGMRLQYNPSSIESVCNPAFPNRLISLEIFNNITNKYQGVKLNATYSLALAEYLRWGGDDYTMFVNTTSLEVLAITSQTALSNYLKHLKLFPPIAPTGFGRVLKATEDPWRYCEPAAPLQPTWRKYTDPESIVFAFFTVLSLIAVVIALVVIVVFRKHPVMVASSSLFLYIVLLGLTFILLSIFFEFSLPKRETCGARTWLQFLGFILAYGSILVKNLRVFQLYYAAQNLQRIKPIPNTKLLFRSSFLLIIGVCILVLWSVLSPELPSSIAQSEANFRRGTYRVVCTTAESWPYILIFAYMGVIMLLGLVLSFLVRKAPSDFQESKWLALVTYATLLLGTILVILFYLATGSELVWFCLRCGFILGLTIICLLFLFGPKMFQVYLAPKMLRIRGLSDAGGGRLSQITGETTITMPQRSPSASKTSHSSQPGVSSQAKSAATRTKTTSNTQNTEDVCEEPAPTKVSNVPAGFLSVTSNAKSDVDATETEATPSSPPSSNSRSSSSSS